MRRCNKNKGREKGIRGKMGKEECEERKNS